MNAYQSKNQALVEISGFTMGRIGLASRLSVLGWEADAAPQHPAKFRHHGCGDFDADLCFEGAIFG